MRCVLSPKMAFRRKNKHWLIPVPVSPHAGQGNPPPRSLRTNAEFSPRASLSPPSPAVTHIFAPSRPPPLTRSPPPPTPTRRVIPSTRRTTGTDTGMAARGATPIARSCRRCASTRTPITTTATSSISSQSRRRRCRRTTSCRIPPWACRRSTS
jgi:hypothetical protein